MKNEDYKLISTVDINRTNLNDFLINIGQNEIGSSLEKLIIEIGSISTLDDVARLWQYFITNFKQNNENKIEKFRRTSEEIATSKIWSGDSDAGTLLAPILRANGIPTVYLQSAKLDWIKDLLENNVLKTSVRGHIFLEIFIDDEWILFDSTDGYFYYNYDVNNYSLPDNYYAFSKSLNGHEIGCYSLANNNAIMMRKFENFNIDNYKSPNYEKIDLQDISNDLNSRRKI